MTNELIKQAEQFLNELEVNGVDVLKDSAIKDIQPFLYDEGDARNLKNIYKSCEITEEELHDLKVLGGAKELLKRRIAILKRRAGEDGRDG